MSKDELNYTPQTPSLTLSATSGNVTVNSKYYGPMTDERKAQAKREVAHRAAQLDLTRVERLPLPRREDID